MPEPAIGMMAFLIWGRDYCSKQAMPRSIVEHICNYLEGCEVGTTPLNRSPTFVVDGLRAGKLRVGPKGKSLPPEAKRESTLLENPNGGFFCNDPASRWISGEGKQ